MMSTGMRTFFSLGFRKISCHCIRVSLHKNSLLRMCVQTDITGKTSLLFKYPKCTIKILEGGGMVDGEGVAAKDA